MVDEPATQGLQVEVQPAPQTETATITPAAVTPLAEAAPVVQPEATLLGAPEKTPTPQADNKTANDNKDAPEAKQPDSEIKKTEGSQSDEPAPLPTYDAFKLPEGMTLEIERSGEFTKTLGEFERITKADHAEVQKLGQVLIERHAVELKKAIEQAQNASLDTIKNQREEWKQSFIKDPEIGGNKQETTVNAAREFIKTHGGTETQQKEFRDLMEQTGLGNHPAMIRTLAKAMSNMAEGKPLPATRPMTQKSKIEKRYGTL